MAFEKKIDPSSIDSHQTSPAAVITILQWADRLPVVDGVNNNISSDNEGISTREKPYAIHSDILNVSFSHTKSQLSPTFTATLTMGDINYATAIHPGDFAFLNIVNWQEKAVTIASNAQKLESINGVDDGFCGVFKIQTVRKVLSIDSNGTKTYLCQIAGAGFTEFNNILHFNPAIAAAFAKDGANVSQFYLGDYFANRLKSTATIQEIIQDLFVILIGKSLKQDEKVENYGNRHFKLPSTVGNLLGIKNVKYASEMYSYITGVWSNNNDSDEFNPGFNKAGKTRGESDASINNFYETGTPLQGDTLIGLDDWNNATAWSIIQQYINSAMNEIYTSYRVSPGNNDLVQPTIIVRQKPFTSENFESQGTAVTRFLSLPRWNLNPDLVFSATLGFEESARINFVQCFTRRLAATGPNDQALQIALGNFFYDKEDIQRNGLKPYIISSNFDFPSKGKEELRAKPWARINADWVIGAHLKESGTIECAGIEDAICVGDNLKFDKTVYHIESITKSLYLAMDGKNRFTTSLKVSYGVLDTASGVDTNYPEMTNSDSQINRQQDYDKGNRILPGFSDTQDIAPRTTKSGGEKLAPNKNKGFN
jgi:hypothetical protein